MLLRSELACGGVPGSLFQPPALVPALRGRWSNRLADSVPHGNQHHPPTALELSKTTPENGDQRVSAADPHRPPGGWRYNDLPVDLMVDTNPNVI